MATENEFGKSELVTNLINELGKDLFEAFAQELIKKKKVASGKLRDSLSYNIIQLLSKYEITYSAEKYLAYIISGRKKNEKFVPPQSIKAWCKAKGIDTKFTFPILLSIHKLGIKPVDLISDVFEKPDTLSKITDKIENVFSNEVEINVANLIQQINKT